MKTSTLLILALTITACSFLPANAKNQKVSQPIKAAMPANQDILIKSVTLISREQKTPPLGVAKKPNRDIGFASVFLRLENKLLDNVTVSIKSIEIRNVGDGKVQNFHQPPQEIHLKPLENSEIVLHLTNKTGYFGHQQVKAVVTYQIKEQVTVIESQGFAVDKK